MARMFPDELSQEAPSEAERRVFDALRDRLPDPFVVFSQVAWLDPEAAGRAPEGEIDFLIAHPSWGLLVLEIKGGVIGYEPAAGWTSNGFKIRDPFEQATRGQHQLDRRLRRSPLTSGYSYSVCRGVWFPDVDVPDQDLRLDAPREILLDAADLDEADLAVEGLYACAPDRTGPGADGVEALIELVAPARTLRPLLSRAMQREAAQINSMTQQQISLMRMLANRPRALIAGCAGSGKTVLAIDKARRLAADGFSVLLTCFNRNLANVMRAQLQDSRVDVANFHDLCYRLGRSAGVELPAEGSAHLPADYFSERLPEALQAAADRMGPRYDAMVVDEGQDFEETWWIPLLDLLKDRERGVLYIFYDDNQAIFGGAHSGPIQEQPFILDRNCRTTQAISRRLRETVADTLEVDCLGPEGRPPEPIELTTGMTERDTLRKQLHRLIHDEKVAPADIVVLTPRRRERSAWVDEPSLGNVSLTWSTTPGPNQVQAATIHSFKGLERPVVILTELDKLYKPEERKLLYVARSRATNHLIEIWPASPATSRRQSPLHGDA